MNKLFCILVLSPMLLFAQSAAQQRTDREMKAMDKYYEMDKLSKKESSDATEKILSYQNEVKDEIRKNRSKLSSEQYEAILNYEKKYWQIVLKRRTMYTFNKDFLNNELPLLNKYRNDTLDYLYNKLSE